MSTPGASPVQTIKNEMNPDKVNLSSFATLQEIWMTGFGKKVAYANHPGEGLGNPA